MRSEQEIRHVPKILAPVQSFRSAVRVINAGADELYCGVTIPRIKDFVLYRGPVTEIPTYDELRKVVKYAHDRGVKVVVCVNNPFMAEIIEEPTRKHILSCIDEDVDALIVGDIGTLKIIKGMNVDIPLYASTHLVSRNCEAVNFLRKLGFSRVILDRHLTIDEISHIVQRSRIEIEVFVHGGGCSNTNGNCHLYHYQFPGMVKAELATSKAFPCGLPFDVYDSSESQEKLGNIPVMDAWTWCSLCKLPELIDTGVAGFKIEGRGSSIWYQESTTRAYRELVNLLAHSETETFKEKLKSLRNGAFVPSPPTPLTLRDFYCEQGRCYYNKLSHAPYRIPLSWQAWTELQFKTWVKM